MVLQMQNLISFAAVTSSFPGYLCLQIMDILQVCLGTKVGWILKNFLGGQDPDKEEGIFGWTEMQPWSGA